jgi:hypothetical protein
MMAQDQEMIANLNYIYNWKDVQMLWMKRSPIFELVRRFRGIGFLVDNIHTSMEEQVAMFLCVVGHN